MALRTFTALSCLLSLIFSLCFWHSMAWGDKAYLFSSLAIVFEAGKWFAWSTFCQQLQQKRWVALWVPGLIFMSLMLLSVFSTSAQLYQSHKHFEHEAQQKSVAYQQLSQQILRAQQQLELMIQGAQKDLQGGFRARALNVLEHTVPRHEHILRELMTKRGTLPQQSLVGLNGLKSLVLWVPVSEHVLEKGLCFVLGCVLDVVSCFLLWLRGGHDTVIKQDRWKPTPLEVTQPFKRKISNNQRAKSEEYQRIRQWITTGKHPPILRLIKEIAQIGTKKAKVYFQDMEKEGILIKRDMRYALTS